MQEIRLPPQNLDAERSILGAILIDEDAMFKVSETLRPEHFYDVKHRNIFESMLELYSHQKAIDVLTLSTELKSKKLLEQLGGQGYLTDLVKDVPTASHIEEYAKIIIELAQRRRLITLAGKIDELAYKQDKELDLVLDEVEKNLMGISQSSTKSDFVHVSSLLEESYKKAEELNKDPGKLVGVPTGFAYLDNILGGLQRSDLIILAARPSVGKTAFSLDIARHASVIEGKSVGIFTLEMSDTQLMDRILSMQVGVGLWDLRMGRISDEVFTRLSDAMGVLSEAKLFIDDTPGINIMEMRAKARKLKNEHGLDLLIIDYLQLMEGRSRENRVQEVSEISRFLKSLARELDVPVVALSQLSRAVEQRGDGTPQLSDLRESGSIEQDADVVLFLSKMGGEDENSQNRKLIISKHRNGPTGEEELFFVKEQARFREIDRVHT
ncbi:MAG TPA: replicative DNA helicase [Candidatus Dojkabacteria bacterium]|jgi:replicative DNA helicase|nr:replicative DNA helicase [Candidatus Dojkabacteria bacterium]